MTSLFFSGDQPLPNWSRSGTTAVARDLHDGIGRQVTVIMMSLQFAERMRERNADRTWAEVANARGQAAEALGDIRLLARTLHPTGLSDDGVADLSASSRLETVRPWR